MPGTWDPEASLMSSSGGTSGSLSFGFEETAKGTTC